MDDSQNALYPRFAAAQVKTALEDTRVVLITGPRQCGKTTLVRDLVNGKREFLTLDDDTVLASARSDPAGLVRGLNKCTIDEVQRAPDLLRAIKMSVDEDRRAGRFLLTGSANLLTVPLVSESLAGRMEIVNLLPLSQAEIHGRKPAFLKAAFQGKPGKPGETLTGKDLVNAVLIGGYPEMLRRKQPERRQRMGTRLHPGHCAERCARHRRHRETRPDAAAAPDPCPAFQPANQFHADGRPDRI